MAIEVSKRTIAKIKDLKPHPRNYNQHPDDQIEHIMQSIKEHGMYRNIVAAKDKTILAGHGVVQAAKKLGMESIPVVYVNIDSDSPQALKLLAGDNEIAHLSMKNDRALSEMLKEINDADIDLLGTGFDEMSLAAFVLTTRNANEIENMDAAAEWLGMPEFGAEQNREKLMLYFETEDDKSKLIEKLELKVIHAGGKKALSTAWWPPKEKNDWSSLRIEAKEIEETEIETNE